MASSQYHSIQSLVASACFAEVRVLLTGWLVVVTRFMYDGDDDDDDRWTIWSKPLVVSTATTVACSYSSSLSSSSTTNGETTTSRHWFEVYRDRMMVDLAVDGALTELTVARKHKLLWYGDILDHDVEAVDRLQAVVRQLPVDQQLTKKYHAIKVLGHLRRRSVLRRWAALDRDIQEKGSQFPVEQGAILLTTFYRDIPEDQLRGRLDALAQEFRVWNKQQQQQLLQQTTTDQRRSANVQMAEALCQFLFNHKGFQGNVDRYYDPSYSLLDRILDSRQGIPLTLSILYGAIARRLGLHVDLIGFPRHFLMHIRDVEHRQDYYMDAFHRGRFLTADQCRAMAEALSLGDIFTSDFLKPTPIKVCIPGEDSVRVRVPVPVRGRELIAPEYRRCTYGCCTICWRASTTTSSPSGR